MNDFLSLFDESFFTPFNTVLVAFLSFLSFKIFKQGIKPFKYISYAWIANLIFLFTAFLCVYFKGKIELLSHIGINYFTFFLDLVSSILIIMAYFSWKRQISHYSKKTFLIIFIFIISIVISKYIFRNDFIKLFVLVSNILSVFSLVLFALLIFEVYKSKLNKNPDLILLGIALYLLAHIVLTIQVYRDIPYILLVDFFAVIAKSLILYGFFQIFVFYQNTLKEEEFEKRAEEKRLSKELEESANLNKELNEILGWTFHELSSPKISLGSTLRSLSKTNKNREDIIEKIKSVCLKEYNLFSSVIDASQKMYIDANPNLKSVDITENLEFDFHNVNTAIQMAVLSFKKKNTSTIHGLKVYNEAVDFELDYGGNCNVFVISLYQLVRVFTNLINNSFQATENEGVTINIKTRINKLDKINKIVVIEFEDNGPGINEEIQDKVFERGFSTKKPNSETPVRGIGLYEIKKIIQENRGTIELESPAMDSNFKSKTQSQVGTKFIITLNAQPLKN